MSKTKQFKPLTSNADDEFAKKTYNFIDQVLKLSLEEKTFTLDDVISETNTILLAVGFAANTIQVNLF